MYHFKFRSIVIHNHFELGLRYPTHECIQDYSLCRSQHLLIGIAWLGQEAVACDVNIEQNFSVIL